MSLPVKEKIKDKIRYFLKDCYYIENATSSNIEPNDLISVWDWRKGIEKLTDDILDIIIERLKEDL